MKVRSITIDNLKRLTCIKDKNVVDYTLLAISLSPTKDQQILSEL